MWNINLDLEGRRERNSVNHLGQTEQTSAYKIPNTSRAQSSKFTQLLQAGDSVRDLVRSFSRGTRGDISFPFSTLRFGVVSVYHRIVLPRVFESHIKQIDGLIKRKVSAYIVSLQRSIKIRGFALVG